MKNIVHYKPAIWLRNGHIQSIIASAFRNVHGVRYTRVRIDTPDQDFLDLDWAYSDSDSNGLAIISHGLEGSSQSASVKGMVKALNISGYDCLAWNYRTCSGETNKQLRMYHNGATDDLDLVIWHAILKGYKKIVLVGLSMGGNITLLYLGQQSTHLAKQIKGAVTFSVPMNLEDSANQLALFSNRVYMKNFLKTFYIKLKNKQVLFPQHISLDNYEKIKNFKQYDDRYTAPIHGYESAEDYWTRCSCDAVLEDIQVPSLIVNAKDDPFLGQLCYPHGKVFNPNIHLEFPRYGGHIGFIQNDIHNHYWSEYRAIDFIQGL